MNIVSKENQNGRMLDGINTILGLRQSEFEKVLERLRINKKQLENICFYYINDQCENPESKIQIGLEESFDNFNHYIGKGYYGGKKYYTSEILQIAEKVQKTFPKDSEEAVKISQLLSTRNLTAFKKYYQKKYNENYELINRLFEIVQNSELLTKFMNYEENKETFSIDGKIVEIKDYLKNFGRIFGSPRPTQIVNNENEISLDFYVENLDEYKSVFRKISQKYNLDRYTNPKYEFKEIGILGDPTDEVIHKGQEPEWKINEELYKCVYDKMPKGLTIEEKAMYIYCMLCKVLKYDQGYYYRNRTKDNMKYSSKFDKERLERIKPESKITCFEFSRIFAKFINNMNGDIEAVIISRGINKGHFLTGFYTDKVSLMLEPINGRSLATNDLAKAKNGIECEGIHIISDRENIIPEALKKAYQSVYKEKSVDIDYYVGILQQLPKPNKLNFEEKMNKFIEMLKEKDIDGNEAVQFFLLLRHINYFGENIQKSFLGERMQRDGKISYERKVLIRTKTEEKNKFYIFDSEDVSIKSIKADDVRKKLREGKYIYENEKQKMEELEEK